MSFMSSYSLIQSKEMDKDRPGWQLYIDRFSISMVAYAEMVHSHNFTNGSPLCKPFPLESI